MKKSLESTVAASDRTAAPADDFDELKSGKSDDDGDDCSQSGANGGDDDATAYAFALRMMHQKNQPIEHVREHDR